MSATHTIKYDEGGLGFSFDANNIEFGPNLDDSAKLKKIPLQDDETLAATGIEGKDADRYTSNGNILLYADTSMKEESGVNYYSLGDSAGCGISIDAGNIQTADHICVRFKFKYNVATTSQIYMFHYGESTTSNNNSVNAYLSSTGEITMKISAVASAGYTKTGVQAWVIGQEYEMEFNINNVNGETSIWRDGILLISQVNSRIVAPPAHFVIGNSISLTSVVQDYFIRDIQIFNKPQHEASEVDFISEIPRFVNIYPTFSSSITPDPNIHGILTDGITGGLVDETIPDSECAVTYILIFSGVMYWHNGTVWVESDGSITESNTSMEMGMNIASFDMGGGGIATFKTLLKSEGLHTPVITSMTFDYIIHGDMGVCSKAVVYGHVIDNCEPITNGDLRIVTENPFIKNNRVVNIDITTSLTSQGFLEEQITPTEITEFPKRSGVVIMYLSYTDLLGKVFNLEFKGVVPEGVAQATFEDLINKYTEIFGEQ